MTTDITFSGGATEYPARWEETSKSVSDVGRTTCPNRHERSCPVLSLFRCKNVDVLLFVEAIQQKFENEKMMKIPP
jgi:hypothetical protein